MLVVLIQLRRDFGTCMNLEAQTHPSLSHSYMKSMNVYKDKKAYNPTIGSSLSMSRGQLRICHNYQTNMSRPIFSLFVAKSAG